MTDRKKLIDEKNGYIRQMNTLEAWKRDAQKDGCMFVHGNMDDLENNILYYRQEIERIDKELQPRPDSGGE